MHNTEIDNFDKTKCSYVYILKSIKDNKLYVGYSINLKNRLLRHKHGRVNATKFRRPLKLVYWEKLKNRYDGRKREKYLKSLYGSREKKKLIENFKGKIGVL